MNDLLAFIEKDIATKKLTIQTLPIKTKTNIKKFNETIENYETKYEEYRSGVRNYLLAKSRSFEINNTEESENIREQIKEKVIELEHIKFLLNPFNTPTEKMGFDVLIYQLRNYYAFNFNSLNEIINNFLDKFEQAGIKLTKNDFEYTCYVNEYMTSFLEARYSTEKDYSKLSEIFEKIYWTNPDIIRHIELNFRKLIRIHSKTFNAYILKIPTEAMQNNNIVNYEDCLEKLKNADNNSIPNGPKQPAIMRNSQRRILPVSTKFGTAYRQIPEHATTINVGVDKKPALTAASPKTSAPTTDKDIPTYLGIRILASFSTSNTNRTAKVSILGEKGSLPVPSTIVSVSPRGNNCSLKSCEER